ncbi:hypothetical protein KPL76_12940 [Subtercola sp. PAMC28395]|uniref:hypothetical protein n=1 Tax=Subtercola sp. PAMC28395 TaxID=2846775 RepID=UPI001C0CE377|nr:hypothetical protein [Subtercola sp. PAMC28395]QWT23597.1 hypothetical protein KPL76_12940 [Subtercola sp. PAMC28395]
MPPISRRNLLVIATSAAGLGGVLAPESASASASVTATAPTIPATAEPKQSDAIALEASAVQSLGDHAPRPVGASVTLTGYLHDQPGGPVTGSFYSLGTVLSLPQRGDNSHATVETQVLSFDEGTARAGTITGSGLVRHDGSGHFTVTGGTGRFSGVRGSYTTTLHPNSGGRGTGAFSIVLT